MAYEGLFKCPQCQSEKTGTNVIATSERAIMFTCADCGRTFYKLASLVSPLSRGLRKLGQQL